MSASSESTPTAVDIGSAMNLDVPGHTHWMQQTAADNNDQAVMQNVQTLAAEIGQPNAGDSSSAQVKFPIFSATSTIPMPRIRSVIVGPSNREDPLVTFVPSLVRQVLQFISVYPSPNLLRSLNALFIDHDTEILPYFRDNHLLTHLAFIMHP
jgi:hypothetical protein